MRNSVDDNLSGGLRVNFDFLNTGSFENIMENAAFAPKTSHFSDVSNASFLTGLCFHLCSKQVKGQGHSK